MADQGRRLDDATKARILRLGGYTPIKQVARIVGVDRNTARKYLRGAVELSPLPVKHLNHRAS